MRDGFRLVARARERGPAWTAQVWDPAAKRYAESKTFKSWEYGDSREAERAAINWARERVTAFRAGLVATTRGGRGSSTAKLLGLYLADLVARSANRTTLANLRKRLVALPRHCPDLGAEDAGRQVYSWWRAWCDEPCEPGGRGSRRAVDAPAKAKSDRTKNNGLIDCRAFLNWCWSYRQVTGLRAPIDIDWIRKNRVEQVVRPQFSVDELRTLLRHKHAFRIRFALYLYLGGRLREALALRWDDISGGHALLRGKGRKQRLVPVQAELTTLLRLHRRGGGDYGGYLFPEAIRADDSGNLARRFDGFLRSAKIEKNDRSTHSLRHCYAGLMTATGEPTALLQAYMGHSQSDMTRHYAQMAARYRADANGWPRGQLRILRQRV